MKNTSLRSNFINEIPYFKGIEPAHAEELESYVYEKRIDRGEMVILEGDRCEAMYFIQAGSVKIFKTSPEGKEQVLRLMRAGETFNEVPVFDGGPNPANVEALENTVLYVIPREKVAEMLRKYPDMSTRVIQVLANRLRQLVGLVEDLSFRHVIGRVAKILLEYAHQPAAAAGTPPRRLTQQQIATMAGTAREVVGRALKTLEQEGAIRMDRGRIIIVSEAALLRRS